MYVNEFDVLFDAFIIIINNNNNNNNKASKALTVSVSEFRGAFDFQKIIFLQLLQIWSS